VGERPPHTQATVEVPYHDGNHHVDWQHTDA
jgi:hypothetical protein